MEVSGGIGYFDMPWRAVKWGASSEKELVLLSFGWIGTRMLYRNSFIGAFVVSYIRF